MNKTTSPTLQRIAAASAAMDADGPFNPSTFSGHLRRRAQIADDLERDKGTHAERLTQLELVDADDTMRRNWPGIDPEFRSLFVPTRGAQQRSIEQMPEVRALSNATSNYQRDTTFTSTLWAALVARSPVLGLATVVRTATGSTHYLSYNATDPSSNGIVSEGSSITNGDPTFGRAVFNAYGYKDIITVSAEMFHDPAFGAEDYVARQFAAGITLRAFGAHTITGDGSGKPLGLANSGTLTAVTAASATVLAIDDIANALQTLPSAAVHSGNCAIILSHDAWGDIVRSTLGTGAAGGQAINAAGYVEKLWNIPVYVDPALAATATGNIVGVVGDLASAYAVRIAPIRTDVDFGSAAATDQVRVRCVVRGDATTMVTGNAVTLKMA